MKGIQKQCPLYGTVRSAHALSEQAIQMKQIQKQIHGDQETVFLFAMGIWTKQIQKEVPTVTRTYIV